MIEARGAACTLASMLDQPSGSVEKKTSRLPNNCLHREDFVIVGWTDPEGSRPYLGALLLGYYTKDGRLHYAGSVTAGITVRELMRLARMLGPLETPHLPIDGLPPRDVGVGSPLDPSRVHWVFPLTVVEVTYLTWTLNNLLRKVSYQGQRDKAARHVVRSIPHQQQRARGPLKSAAARAIARLTSRSIA